MKICEDSEILYNIFSDEEKVTIPITIDKLLKMRNSK